LCNGFDQYFLAGFGEELLLLALDPFPHPILEILKSFPLGDANINRQAKIALTASFGGYVKNFHETFFCCSFSVSAKHIDDLSLLMVCPEHSS